MRESSNEMREHSNLAGPFLGQSGRIEGIYGRLPLLLAIAIGLAYCYLTSQIVMVGDDLGFFFGYEAQRDYWLSLPRHFYRHWLWENGRFADFLAPVWLNIVPSWLNWLLCGVTTGGMFWLTLKCGLGKAHRPTLALATIALMAFTLRWDAVWMEFMTIYGYLLSSCLGLAALWLWMHPSRSNALMAACAPLAFVAMAMHEAFGVAVALPLAAYALLSKGYWKRLGAGAKLYLLALVAGGFFPATSPPLWARVERNLQPEFFWTMAIFSGGYVLLLLAVLAWMWRTRRATLLELVRGPWVVFATGSLISFAMMLASGFGGRPGWFAQLLAIVALLWIAAACGLRLEGRGWRCLGWACAVAVAGHYAALAWWQTSLSDETRQVLALYRESPDGVVYFDFRNEPELPWWLLRKTHGVPDADDTYYRHRISTLLGQGKPLVVLPVWSRQPISEGRLPVSKDGVLITDRELPTYGDALVAQFPRRMAVVEGRECIENAFPLPGGGTGYAYIPVDRDPGEK